MAVTLYRCNLATVLAAARLATATCIAPVLACCLTLSVLPAEAQGTKNPDVTKQVMPSDILHSESDVPVEKVQSRNTDEDLFQGRIVKSVDMSVPDLAKILGVSLVSTSKSGKASKSADYPCTLTKFESPNRAVSSGLAVGDKLLGASISGNSLMLAVDRAGQVFRLTTQVPAAQPLFNTPSVHPLSTFQLGVTGTHENFVRTNTYDPISALLQVTNKHSNRHPKKRPGCTCIEDQWCTDQCPRTAYCNCPSMTIISRNQTNADQVCSWSGQGAPRFSDSQVQTMKSQGQQAQSIRSQRWQLEQRFLRQ